MKALTLTLVLLVSCRSDDPGKETGTTETGDTVVDAVDADSDGFDEATDCDDTNADINPSAPEVCDGIDNDCDGLVDDADEAVDGQQDWNQDLDGDGFGNPDVTQEGCEPPSGFVEDGTDCNDLDATFHPGADESDCTDERDFNCDGSVGYADEDSDGFAACEDCDDTTASSNPLAFEICDGSDNDCDGTIDENDAVDVQTWYADTDSDGYGDAANTSDACDAPSDYVDNDTDCNDSDATVNESANEVCDSIDNDCDGWVDDDDPDVTGTTTWYGDSDGDGYGGQQYQQEACEMPPGFVASTDDCNDLDPASHPGAVEVCDESDNDCDGSTDEGVLLTFYADADGDGYGDSSNTTEHCDQPPGYQSNSNDCDDSNASSRPGGIEVCDGADNDCDGTIDDNPIDAGTWYTDADGDGYGNANSNSVSCTQQSNTVTNATDCDDTLSTTNPAATEACDSVDNDCDGTIDESDAADASTWYADADGDGFGDNSASVAACTTPNGYVADNTDCDDQNGASTNTTSDADCDGTVTADDCDDTSATSTTLATDGDCDGTLTAADCDDASATSTTVATDADCDGYLSAADCNDGDASIHPGATEICDGLDNDCDGTGDEEALGSEAACPALSCLDLQQNNTSATTGTHWIAPLGTTFEAYCDMDSEGGGWTLVAWINSGDRLHANNAATVGDVTAMSAGSKLSDALTTALNTGGYWRYECGNAKRSNVKTDSGTFNSAYNNSENWWLDNDKNGTYECAANRSGYVFADYPGCAAGHTDYGATDGTGCYIDGEGWSRPGSLWAR